MLLRRGEKEGEEQEEEEEQRQVVVVRKRETEGKNGRRKVDGGSAPSYNILMEKLSKLQGELRTSPIKKVAVTVTAAVHWKAQAAKHRRDDRSVQTPAVVVHVDSESDDLEVEEQHVLIL